MATGHQSDSTTPHNADVSSRSSKSTGSGVIKRRNRKAVSCAPCRARKLRCDRAVPACSNCVNRVLEDDCVYSSSHGRHVGETAVTFPERRRHAAAGGRRGNTPVTSSTHPEPESLYAKLERLESVIHRLTTASHQTASKVSPSYTSLPNQSINFEDAATDGMSTPEASRRATVPLPFPSAVSSSSPGGEALWDTLLSELAEVRVQVRSHASAPPQYSAPTIFFGNPQATSQAEILLQLPSRHTCDKMIDAYFSGDDSALCILHPPTFRQQYETFWQQPKQTSTIWIAVLFGLLHIAVRAWLRDGGEPVELQGKCSDLATSYRCRIAECLVHADYAHPQEHLVEALLLHLYALYMASHDFNPNLWVLLGLIVRTSVRAGYHIDSSSLRHGTPFHAEMRRRAWTYIRQADIFFSFQTGLPSMLHPRWLDGALPSNLHDKDFGPQSVVLPPPIPDAELTPVSYLTAKAKLAFGFARALAELDQPDQVDYARVLRLDRGLRNIYQSIPRQYQVTGPLEEPAQDLHSVVTRLALANIYQKALCVVHSKYLKAASTDQQYLYSRLACLDSAMTLLSFLIYQHQHFHVDGRKTRLTRYQKSLTIHDYFLAATLLCTSLFLSKSTSQTEFPLLASAGPGKDEILEAIEKSMAVFNDMRSDSAEARRAYELLSPLLHDLRQPAARTGSRAARSPHAYRESSHTQQARTSEISPQLMLNTEITSAHNSNVSDPSQGYDMPGEIQSSMGDGQTFDDMAQPWGEWDTAMFDLDLGDPMSFVNNMHFFGDTYG